MLTIYVTATFEGFLMLVSFWGYMLDLFRWHAGPFPVTCWTFSCDMLDLFQWHAGPFPATCWIFPCDMLNLFLWYAGPFLVTWWALSCDMLYLYLTYWTYSCDKHVGAFAVTCWTLSYDMLDPFLWYAWPFPVTCWTFFCDMLDLSLWHAEKFPVTCWTFSCYMVDLFILWCVADPVFELKYPCFPTVGHMIVWYQWQRHLPLWYYLVGCLLWRHGSVLWNVLIAVMGLHNVQCYSSIMQNHYQFYMYLLWRHSCVRREYTDANLISYMKPSVCSPASHVGF